MPRAILTLLLMSAAVTTQADVIWRCPGADGEPVFSNQPCEGAEPVTLPPLGEISAMELPAQRQTRPQTATPAAREREAAPRRAEGPLSFGERTRWRQLRIELDGLERDLQRGLLQGRERSAVQARIRAARQEFAPLERRARIHPPTP